MMTRGKVSNSKKWELIVDTSTYLDAFPYSNAMYLFYTTIAFHNISSKTIDIEILTFAI